MSRLVLALSATTLASVSFAVGVLVGPGAADAGHATASQSDARVVRELRLISRDMNRVRNGIGDSQFSPGTVRSLLRELCQVVNSGVSC